MESNFSLWISLESFGKFQFFEENCFVFENLKNSEKYQSSILFPLTSNAFFFLCNM